MDQTCLANSGGFAPISFPLFHGMRFGGGRIEFSSSMVILLELSEDGMVRRMPDPLNYGSFRERCRHRPGLGTDKGGCLCPSTDIAGIEIPQCSEPLRCLVGRRGDGDTR